MRLLRNMPQIGGQSVRKIGHGVHLRAFTEPETFGRLCDGCVVYTGIGSVEVAGQQVAQSGTRSAEHPCHDDRVARTGVAAAFDAVVGGTADDRDVDRDVVPRRGRVAAGEHHPLLGREIAVSP